MSRWENLQQEIADEFAQEHPLCNTNPPALIYEMHRKQQLVYFERTGPRQKPRGKVGKRPVVMPAQPTKYQRSYIRRRGMREKLPDTRPGVTHHFEIFDSTGRTTDGYITTGIYESGQVGEIFVKIGAAGDAMGPLLDQWAIAASVALQMGADFESFIGKFVGSRFEPSGATKNKDIPRTTSPLDYIARFLLKHHVVSIATPEVQTR